MRSVCKNRSTWCLLALVLIGSGLFCERRSHWLKAKAGWERELQEYRQAQALVEEILRRDADVLKPTSRDGVSSQCRLDRAIYQIAERCGIDWSAYRLQPDRKPASNGQWQESSRLTLLHVRLAQFARFFSEVDSAGSGLRCTSVRLHKGTHDKGDQWQVEFDLHRRVAPSPRPTVGCDPAGERMTSLRAEDRREECR